MVLRPGSRWPARARPPCRTPAGDRQPDAVVDVAVLEDRVRLAVVAAQRDPLGAVPEHGRDQVGEVLAGRALPDEDPHALAALLLRFVEHRALVVRLDPGGQVGVELPARTGRARGRRPGGRPAAAILASSSASPATTPGKFMTSATPMAPCSSSSSRTSAACELARRGSRTARPGTQLEAQMPNVNGRPAAAWASAATPRTPNTLAISCGSAATAVVPSGSTARTNSSTQSLVDSRCMWASMKPGVSAAPADVHDLAGLARPPARRSRRRRWPGRFASTPGCRGRRRCPRSAADQRARRRGRRRGRAGCRGGQSSSPHLPPAGFCRV